jgi:hypothetical protein
MFILYVNHVTSSKVYLIWLIWQLPRLTIWYLHNTTYLSIVFYLFHLQFINLKLIDL